MNNSWTLARLAFGHAYLVTGAASMAAVFRNPNKAAAISTQLGQAGIRHSLNGCCIAILLQ
ncbi:MAG: hypothetical protein PHQ40_16435 [Anaerolineaceae bacterium]|nr:hypothetical protein [Anaerolineaceae bacterium]